MRLLYVHNIAMPGPEANTVNVAKMCDAFAANGCTATLAALPGAPAHDLTSAIRAHYDLRHTLNVIALPPMARRPLAAAVASIGAARDTGADLIYSRAPHVTLAACLAGIDTVLEMHLPAQAFSPLGQAAYQRALGHPRLRGVVAISGVLAKRLGGEIGARTPLIVAHDGADARPPLPLHLRTGDRLSAGFVGRFYRGKGLELIAALAPLCPWADFHVVGGDAKDAARLLGEHPASNIIFHGALSHADAVNELAHWDVTLAPYQGSVIVADGKSDAAAFMSPLKIFEYMAAGKAILASDLPVLHEVLTDGVTAMLLPPDAPAAWADALAKLRDNPLLGSRLGARAREVFTGHYTWHARARHILQSIAPAKVRHTV